MSRRTFGTLMVLSCHLDLVRDPSGAKQRDLAAGYCAAIERCGDLLEAHFPIDPGDENELRDHLIVKH